MVASPRVAHVRCTPPVSLPPRAAPPPGKVWLGPLGGTVRVEVEVGPEPRPGADGAWLSPSDGPPSPGSVGERQPARGAARRMAIARVHRMLYLPLVRRQMKKGLVGV